MKEKAYKIKVSVSLDEDIIETIKDLAEQDDRNFSSYINKVLKDHIQNLSADTKKYYVKHIIFPQLYFPHLPVFLP